jgi:hypothetical protein
MTSIEERIEALADLSVARGCAFACLAIMTMMIGFLGDPALALRAGAVMALLVAAVLLLKSELAGSRNYKRTEVWLMLEKHERPRAADAQQIIGRVLKLAYARFARRFAIGGVLLAVAAALATALR